MNKSYIGDGCYAEWDGYGITLTTENGISVTNKIFLEPETLRALNLYSASIRSIQPVSTPLLETVEELFPEGDG